jgi:hypothetical protein
MNNYAVFYHCPSGICVDIHVTANSPQSARQKAYRRAVRFLRVPKGQRPGLRVEHVLKIVKGMVAK